MAEIVRNKDWSETPFGPIDTWPQSLKTVAALMLESRFAMVVAWGPDFRFLYNDRYRPVLGNKHPEALGKPARDIFPEVWDDIIGPLFQRTRRGEAVMADDLYIPLHRHGYLENCYFSISYSPIRDESGGVGGMLAVVAETTERIEGERRLLTLRDLARRATEVRSAENACADAIEILRANPADVPFALVYLLDDEGAVARLVAGTGIAEQHPAAPRVVDLSAPAQAWPIGDALQSGHAVVVDDVVARFGELPSQPYPEPVVSAVVLPLVRPGGRSYGVMVAGVCARRALNERYRDFFELTAEHITTGLANGKAFAEERKRADALAELDRAKTTFFSNVSHEFRTPLTLMLGPLEQALRDARHLREPLEIAHRNSLRLLKLVNSLLDFSRIEAGRIDASYEPTDLARLTIELASLFRSAVEKAGLKFIVHCPPLPEPVYVDHDMWEKIVFNLLSNALKFTFEGEIEIALARSDPGAVLLRVRDTGTGIPAAELARVFERFHRVRNARARSHEGTGIGLALVQELVRLHGGTITAESREGEGTTFTVSIPLGSAHLPANRIGANRLLASTTTGALPYVDEALRWLPDRDGEPQAQPSFSPDAIAASRTLGDDPPALSTATVQFDAAPAADQAHGRPLILLADDNGDMRNYIRRLLVESGYDVLAVGDGVAALDAARARAPAIVLADVMMPRLDGFGLLRELRAAEETSTIPIILVSARAGEEARVEGIAAGADDYLTKPFGVRELLARVETHLKLAQLRREATSAAERERRRMHDVLLRTPAMVCVLRGPQHTFELANQHYLGLIGRHRPDEILGRPVRAVLPEVAEQGFIDLLDRVYATGEPYVGTERRITLLPPGGPTREIIVNFVYQPTHDTHGNIDGILVHATDITDLVRARETIAQRREELERLVDERTATLRQTIEQMEEFSYSVSHDLRSPVRAMRGYAEVLLAEHSADFNADARELLDRIHRNGVRMDRLIQDLLTYTRITRRDIQLEPVALDRLVPEIVQQYAELRSNDAQIEVLAPLPTVLAHEPSLTQVISNLLTNAVKFVAPGTRPRVLVGHDVAGDRVRVWVQDNGIGIAPEHQARLFTMFERVHAHLPYDGTGVGLAIVRKAVERMNGRVGVRSDGQTGSCFWIELERAAVV